MHPLPAKIVEYRQYAKLKGTYVDALPEMVHPETGRVHASFNQVVAATGRLSSSDPNLQNIPVRTEEGREIRSAFVPGQEGWVLLAADYSQIELRVLAHYSGDERLLRGVPPRRGHPRPGGQPGQRRAAGGGHRRDAAAGQGGQLRHDLRAKRRSGWPSGWASSRPPPPSSSTTISGSIPASRNSWSAYWPNAARKAMLARSWGGGGRSRASAPRPAAPATSPSGPPSTRSSRARRPT